MLASPHHPEFRLQQGPGSLEGPWGLGRPALSLCLLVFLRCPDPGVWRDQEGAPAQKWPG